MGCAIGCAPLVVLSMGCATGRAIHGVRRILHHPWAAPWRAPSMGSAISCVIHGLHHDLRHGLRHRLRQPRVAP